jgi:hypothetical protein
LLGQPERSVHAGDPESDIHELHAQEREAPPDREALDWKFTTNLPGCSRDDAIGELHWYAMRWKIETFHKILKFGCKTEESKLRTAEWLLNLISVYCILSWRILWMTMINRVSPDGPPTLALTRTEITTPERLMSGMPSSSRKTVSYCLTSIAKLGGYLARKGDPPPGHMARGHVARHHTPCRHRPGHEHRQGNCGYLKG